MKSESDKLFETVAKQKNTSAEAVRQEIENTILIAMVNGTEEQREKLRSYSADHTTPTPEEVIAGMADQILKETKGKK